jgi:hypothetical protein
MRISDDRYQRDRQRLDVAVQFIEHEARTQTIRLWTGLTDDRIRKLYRSYLTEHRGRLLPRHRGKSPQQIAHFVRTARLRQESALFASICLMAEVIVDRPAGNAANGATGTAPARSAYSVTRALQLCRAYDTYRWLVQRPSLSFEHAVFLVSSLSRGDELRVAGCAGCNAVLVADRLSLRVPRCAGCGGGAALVAPPEAVPAGGA